MTGPIYYTLTSEQHSPDINEIALRAGRVLSPSRDWHEILRGDYPEVWPDHEQD